MNTITNHAPNTPIMDTQDKAITFTGPSSFAAARATIDAIEDALGYRMDTQDTGGVVYLVPDHRYDQKPLTIPERAIVAAFATHFSRYTPGLERNAAITFPRIVTAPGCDTSDMGAAAFESEARAYQFAEVAANVFELNAEVVETPVGDGWLVVVSSPDGSIDSAVFEQLRGVCAVLTDYRIERIGDAQDGDTLHHIANDAQRAILGRLDTILARLGSHEQHNAPEDDLAASIQNGRELVDNIEAVAEVRRADRAAAKTSRKKKTA